MRGTIIAILVTLCPVVCSAQKALTAQQYAEKYAPLAIKDMQQYKIPASITLAQGILESACGTSRLAVEGNNHFGIKCKSDWQGETIIHDDDMVGECFRKYSSVEDSYKDHSIFLSTRSRYSSLFQLDILDYRAWAQGLKNAGYATNPLYAENLIRIIENYRLYEYDKESSTRISSLPQYVTGTQDSLETITKEIITPEAVKTGIINGTKYIIAHTGDSFTIISFKTDIPVKKLLAYNDLRNETMLEDGTIIYLGKKQKFSSTNSTHIVNTKTTLYKISQLYGISLKSLKKMNPSFSNGNLPIGSEIKLR